MRRCLLVALLVGCGSSTSGKVPVDPDPKLDTDRPVEYRPDPVAPVKPPRAWPMTKVESIADQIHGKTVADPYRWLEDEKSAEVQAWMTEQDTYARTELAKLPGRDDLAQRMRDLLYYDSITAPQVKKGRFFYSRKHKDKEKVVVYWKQGETGTEKVLFDPNTWSTDGTTGLGAWTPSHDGKLVAYAVKENNSDESVMHVMDVSTGKDRPDVIEGTKYSSASWTPDGKGFYYTWIPPVGGDVTVANRPGFAEIRFHKLGTDVATDPVIHPATKDAGTFIGANLSTDGHWLLVTISHGWNSADIYFKDARKPKAAFTPLVAKVDADFNVRAWKDQFYVHTNDGAPRYRVFKVDPKRPQRAAWKEIVAQSDATLTAVDVVGNHLSLTYLRNATSELAVHDLSGKFVRKIELPGIGSSGGLGGNEDEDTAYFAYTSFTEPQVIFKTSVKTGTSVEWARIKLPVNLSDVVAEQVSYPSKDGTQISMFIIHKKDLAKTGKHPTILYGYGGFNVSQTPSFSSTRALWLESGGVYVVANLRGGGEFGEEWHRAGMLLKKQNVFDDFIAAAETLIKDGWTSKEHLAIWGGSNGGLLVGAAVTQRPDLFGAVICGVPLLDMLRFHLYGSGKTWVPEYGSAEDPEQFAALYAYSPYRVAVDAGERDYPAIMFDSADHDDRVDPMHARKLAAVIQANQTGNAPILLRIERNAGHGGADMVKQQVERIADQLAFLWSRLK